MLLSLPALARRAFVSIVLVLGTFGWMAPSAHAQPEIVVEQPAGNPLINAVSTVDFGAVAVGDNSVRVFTIRNTGTTDLTVSPVEIQQSDSTKGGVHCTAPLYKTWSEA